MSYIRWFDEVCVADVGFVGGKAANLGEMVAVGLPVRPGFCSTPRLIGTSSRRRSIAVGRSIVNVAALGQPDESAPVIGIPRADHRALRLARYVMSLGR